jgi:hypothetical protein
MLLLFTSYVCDVCNPVGGIDNDVVKTKESSDYQIGYVFRGQKQGNYVTVFSLKNNGEFFRFCKGKYNFDRVRINSKCTWKRGGFPFATDTGWGSVPCTVAEVPRRCRGERFILVESTTGINLKYMSGKLAVLDKD